MDVDGSGISGGLTLEAARLTRSDDLRCREIEPAGQEAIIDVVVGPIADGLHPVEAVVGFGE